MNMILASLLGYAIGAAPVIYFLAKMRGIDLRSAGTGNLGAGNLWNATGPRFGAFGLGMEIAKGAVAVLIPVGIGWGSEAEAMGAIGAVVGQMWPVTLGFRGGRGNGTATGALFALSPATASVCLAIFLVATGPKVWRVLRRRVRVAGAPSRTVPVGVLVAFASFAVFAAIGGDNAASITALAFLLLILVRRATAPWPVDPTTGVQPKRSLTSALLYDRPMPRPNRP